jgi:hypothetical protein
MVTGYMKPTEFNIKEIERMVPNMAKFNEVKPKQKNGESEDEFKKRIDSFNTRRHAHLLKTQAETRMGRVVASILSVGALAVHNPNQKQVDALMLPLTRAIAATKERLEGKASAKPSFVLPD